MDSLIWDLSFIRGEWGGGGGGANGRRVTKAYATKKGRATKNYAGLWGGLHHFL